MALRVTAFTITADGKFHVKSNQCPARTTCINRGGRRCPYLVDGAMDDFQPFVRCRCPSPARQRIRPKLIFYSLTGVPYNPLSEYTCTIPGHVTKVEVWHHETEGEFSLHVCDECRAVIIKPLRPMDDPHLYTAITNPGGITYGA